MSGTESCASCAPSQNSTSECTMDCGWITTSIFSAGTEKSLEASITSKPLFIMVAESTEIFGPIFQTGCAKASLGVTFSKKVLSFPLKGPPDAVIRRRAILSLPPAARHWKMALCSLSTGMISAPVFLASLKTSSPPETSTSLVAMARRFPAFTALKAASSPANPTTLRITTSAESPSDATPSLPLLTSRAGKAFLSSRAPAGSLTATVFGANSFICSQIKGEK